MSNFDVLTSIRHTRQAAVEIASKALQEYPKGPDGRTLPEVRATDEWQSANLRYRLAHEDLQAVNKLLVRYFKAEHKAQLRKEYGR